LNGADGPKQGWIARHDDLDLLYSTHTLDASNTSDAAIHEKSLAAR
jgi:hypothetical protein